MNWWIPIVIALLLSGCGFTPQGDAAKAALKQGIVIINEAHFKAAMASEKLRCERSLRLVLRMADVKGDAWLNAYAQSCPNVRAAVERIVGATVFHRTLAPTPK